VLIITCASLSGGQGKTTTAILLGRYLNRLGYRVLMVDADPQSSLTFYLGHEVQPNQPTLLEVLKRQVKVEDGIYETAEHLWLIPSDDALDSIQEFLSSSGMGAVTLKRRLKDITDLFQVCIVDAPPQRSQLCLTAVGAADVVLVPAEASSKGVNSLLRTLELIRELESVDAFTGSVAGVLPFRDRWLGRTQTHQSRRSIELMQEIAGDIPLLPSIVESEQYKKAIDQGTTLAALDHPQLEYPIEQVAQLLRTKWPETHSIA
jgi:chromosome partitioning protein